MKFLRNIPVFDSITLKLSLFIVMWGRNL